MACDSPHRIFEHRDLDFDISRTAITCAANSRRSSNGSGSSTNSALELTDTMNIFEVSTRYTLNDHKLHGLSAT
jgi:hypothetical protein